MTDILGELLLILYISRATINVLSDKTTQHCPVYIYKKTRKNKRIVIRVSFKYNIVNKCKKILVCDRCPLNMKFQKRINKLFLALLLCSFHTSQPSRVEGNTHKRYTALHTCPSAALLTCTSMPPTASVYHSPPTSILPSPLPVPHHHYLFSSITTICVSSSPPSVLSSPSSRLLPHHNLFFSPTITYTFHLYDHLHHSPPPPSSSSQ